MKNLRLGAVALAIVLGAAEAPAADIGCPAAAGQRLVYIDVYDGPPEKEADLVPDQHKAAGRAWNTWELAAGPDGIWVKCGYGKKLEGPYARVENVRLPDTVKSCRADFTTGPGRNELTLQKFACR